MAQSPQPQPQPVPSNGGGVSNGGHVSGGSVSRSGGGNVSWSGGQSNSGMRGGPGSPYINSGAAVSATLEALAGGISFEEAWLNLNSTVAERLIGVLGTHTRLSGDTRLLHRYIREAGGELSAYQLGGLVGTVTDDILCELAERWPRVDRRIPAEVSAEEWGEALCRRYLDERHQIGRVITNPAVQYLRMQRLLTLAEDETFDEVEYWTVRGELFDQSGYTETWIGLCDVNHPAALAVAIETAVDSGWRGNPDTAIELWFGATRPEEASRFGIWYPKEGEEKNWLETVFAEVRRRGVRDVCETQLRRAVKEIVTQLSMWDVRWGTELSEAREDVESTVLTLGPDFWHHLWGRVQRKEWEGIVDEIDQLPTTPAGVELWEPWNWATYKTIQQAEDPDAAEWLIRELVASREENGNEKLDVLRPVWFAKAIGRCQNTELIADVYAREGNGMWGSTVARRLIELAGPEESSRLVSAEHFLRDEPGRSWWQQQLENRHLDVTLLVTLGGNFQGSAAELLACVETDQQTRSIA